MERGDLYLVSNASAQDPKPRRPVVIVSRQILIDSRHSTIVCATIHSDHGGTTTQVAVGIQEGLKWDSSIHCDELISLPKQRLTHYVGSLSSAKVRELNRALIFALALENEVEE